MPPLRPKPLIFGEFPDLRRVPKPIIEMGIYAIDVKTGEQRPHMFHFVGETLFSSTRYIESMSDEKGQVGATACAEYLVRQAVEDERDAVRALWDSTTEDVTQDAIIAFYQGLTSKYAEDRPTS